MKIKKLWIKKYKNLKDFNIDFQSDNPISIFIGNNGSGKSNLLEAIILIFKYLYLETEDAPYFIEYKIEYECNDNIILIETNKIREYRITINGNDGDLSILRAGDINNKYLPDNIVVYYSGFNQRVKKITQRFEKNFQKNIEKLGKNSVKNIFYLNPEHYPLIFLSLLSSDLENTQKYVLEKFNIKKVEEFYIVLKKPYWAKDKENFDTFWGAFEGEVRTFLMILKENCDNIKPENILVFSGSKLSEIRENDNIGYARDLFKKLDVAYSNDLIEKIFIKVLKNNGDKVEDHNFSEGERQLITIRGMAEFFGYKETLFLFDEPDTFLHPTWQKDFINDIASFISRKNQYIITTHSPLLLNNANKNVADLYKIADGKVYNFESHYGTDIETVNFKMMDVESRPKEIKEQLSELYNYLEIEDIKEAEKLYNKLIEILGKDDCDLIQIRVEIDFLKEMGNVED